MRKHNYAILMIAILVMLFFTGCTEPVYETRITLDRSELLLNKGEEADVEATVGPDYVQRKNVTWSIDNHDVASVEKGHITAKKAGNAVVTASSENGLKAMINLKVVDVNIVAGRKPISEIIAADDKLKASTTLSVAGTLTEDDFAALKGMENLTSLDLSEVTNTEIPVKAFTGSKLTSIKLPNDLVRVGEQAFAGSKLTSIVIPDNVKVIGVAAFNSAADLVSVQLPEGLETIGNQAFSSCTSLKTINLPVSLKDIGREAFMMTSNLEFSGNVLTMPEKLEKVGVKAFLALKNITEIVLPANFNSLADTAFPKSVKTFTFLGAIPPVIDLTGEVVSARKDATVYVPSEEAKKAYSASENFLSMFALENIKVKGE